MKIEKGHYVPKELITSEAIHDAVIAAFVAAGFKDARPKFANFGDSSCHEGIGVHLDGDIVWVKCPRNPLTLQELFTAENGLKWPEWAESIKANKDAVWFDGADFYKSISVRKLGWRESDAITIATRQQPKKDPQPDCDWWDCELGKAVGPAPIGERVLVDCTGGSFKKAVVIGLFERWNWCDIEDLGIHTVDFCNVMPLDHETRKSDRERKRFVVDAAMEVAVDAHMTEDILSSLYDAGFLKLPD